MIGDLFFSSSGCPYPAYVLDSLGNLVRCSGEGAGDALVPFSVELVSTAADLRNPFPWTITVEKILSRLEFVAEALPHIASLYPGSTLSQAEHPFVNPGALKEDLRVVDEAISIFPNLPAEQAVLLRDKLAENGVFEIPYCSTFNANIHEAVGDGIFVPPIAYVSAGWMSNMKVYRKALIRSA
ncbi:hypothetical protein [Pseudomonas baetica]|uniref:hypothetical protein n=1 Tax=Pseudomonas baetica TaxID=674054 RepID=UPI002406A122|nr:hypothetical protein [Pseudomonas baetica]MDF9778822.1 hypothetical protein [Pseudomonas baetica]